MYSKKIETSSKLGMITFTCFVFDEKSKGVFGPWNKNNTNGISKYRHLVYNKGMLIFNLLRRPLFNKIYNGKYNIV